MVFKTLIGNKTLLQSTTSSKAPLVDAELSRLIPLLLFNHHRSDRGAEHQKGVFRVLSQG